MAGSRSRIILYVIAAGICLIGLADATYLMVQYLTGETAVCGASPDCSKVLTSPYAKVARIPVAAFGVLGYFGAFSLATFAAFGYARARQLFAFAIGAMFAATLWLLFVQAFLLHAFCRYCLFSAALVFVLAAMVIISPASSGED